MIKIFFGGDTKRAHRALAHEIKEGKKSHPEAVVFRFDDLNFDLTMASEALSGVSLFGGKNIVIFDGVTEHPGGSVVFELMTEYQESQHIILCREQTIEQTILEKLRNYAVIEEFPLVSVIKKEKPSNFAIADAFARRDRKGAWVEFEIARRKGIAAEEIHGILFWQVKTLYISATQTKEEAIKSGIKEYSWKKAVRHTKNFLTSDLERLLGSLKDMYHQSHRGEIDLDIAIEKFLLTV